MNEEENFARLLERAPRSYLICPKCEVNKTLERYCYQFCEDCMAPCVFCGFKMFPRRDGGQSVCNSCAIIGRGSYFR